MKPEVKSAKAISTQTLRAIWKKVSAKPMPKIYAYLLNDKEFLKTVRLIRKNENITDTRVTEYGVDFNNTLIEASTFEFKGNMIVFVKESASLEAALKHELEHISVWKHEDLH